MYELPLASIPNSSMLLYSNFRETNVISHFMGVVLVKTLIYQHIVRYVISYVLPQFQTVPCLDVLCIPIFVKLTLSAIL